MSTRLLASFILIASLSVGACVEYDLGFGPDPDSVEQVSYPELTGTWSLSVQDPGLGTDPEAGSGCEIDDVEVTLVRTGRHDTPLGAEDRYRVTHEGLHVDCSRLDPDLRASLGLPGTLFLSPQDTAGARVYDLPSCFGWGCDANPDPDPDFGMRLSSLAFFGKVRSGRSLRGAVMLLVSDTVRLWGTFVATR